MIRSLLRFSLLVLFISSISNATRAGEYSEEIGDTTIKTVNDTLKTSFSSVKLSLDSLQKRADSLNLTEINEECLELSGLLTKDGKPQTGATIQLFLENKEIASLTIGKQSKFKFKLRKDSYYTLVIRKPGYVTRYIGVSTKIPPETPLDNLFRFHFEMELISERVKLDPFYADFPVAIISYDSKIDGFQNDNRYSTRIKKYMVKK